MGQVQLWQSDGLGADRHTLGKVLRTFRSDGVTSIESQQALDAYIRKLGNSKLKEMYEIDEEAAIQILVDCFGVAEAFRKYILIAEYTNANLKELNEAGWISPKAYEEVTAKYEECIKKANEEKDKILSDYTCAAWKAEEAENQIKELKETLAHYKADLYDFYARAGKLPNYERG